MGVLDPLSPAFKVKGMSRDDFGSLLAEVMAPRDWVVTFIADSTDGRIPVGSLSAMNPLGTRLVTIVDIVWFPWASTRNRLESIVNFVNDTREDYIVLEYADDRAADKTIDGHDAKRLFETVCKYGAMRRVGTVHDFYGAGNSAALYQSRKRKN